MVSAVFFLACSNDKETLSEPTLNDIANFELIIENLETSVSAAENEVIIYENHEIIQIENKTYLRSYGGDYITTTSLETIADGRLQSRGVSCTSKQCATTSGCIPNSAQTGCTSCGGGLGDCVKTVSTEITFE